MNNKSFTIILLFFAIVISAQVPKKILMEYATNASCPPCAEFNPGNYEFLKSNYKNTVAVWYHAWWPGPNDPMYLANTDENAARINYYRINGVPDYVLNGTDKGWSTNDLTADLASDHEKIIGLESPFQIKVNSIIGEDSLEIFVNVKSVGELTSDDLVLHTAITERMVNYQSPPGTNGEKQFPHVFRKFCAGSSGESIPSLSMGDSLEFSYKMKMDSLWNADVLTIVAWVQSHSSREVVQSTSNLFFYEIISEDPEIDFIEFNNTNLKHYYIENILEEEINIRLKSILKENNENWIFSLLHDGAPFDSTDINLAPGEVYNFDLSIQTNLSAGTIDLEIVAKNLDEYPNFKSSKNYYGVVTSGDILIVDDDGGENYDINYTDYFENLEKPYTKLSSSAIFKIEDIFDFTVFKYVFWNLGIESPSLDMNDARILRNYLDAGGNLFIAGQDLGYDIHEVTMLSTPRILYRFYFDVLYLSNSDSSDHIVSIPGNPFFENISIELNDIYPVSPDAVQSKSGNSIPILKYSDSENAAMLINTREQAKIAYLTFGLEQISSVEIKTNILDAVINWFDTPTGLENKGAQNIQSEYLLDQNYPNPFNPSTTISYSIKEKGMVELKIFNVLGEELKTLVDEYKFPGQYKITFNASEFNSGVYFYSLKVNDFNSTKKMVVIK